MEITHRRRLGLLLAAILAAAVAIATVALLPAAADAGARGKPRVTVMTRNLYLGADLTPAILAPDVPALMKAHAEILTHVHRVTFVARAKVLAAEIAEADPDLLGLQEVTLWRSGPLGDPAPATTVIYDHLALLQAELNRLGHPYDVVVSQVLSDLEAPVGEPYLVDGRFTDHDVILARRGAHLRLSNVQTGVYASRLSIPLPSTGEVVHVLRGWNAVDVVKGNKRFRFVNTHLEAFVAGIRVQQAEELIAGPLTGAPAGRVILAGDLNSGPELPVPDNRVAYFRLTAAGMVDTWLALHPGEPGYTASYGDDLDEPVDSLEHRVDLVMIRGAVRATKTKRYGNDPANRTPSGQWPSDHLGVAAQLQLTG